MVRAALPKGRQVTRLRGALGTVFDDADFADWFAAEGRAAPSPAMLAPVMVLQHLENLTDRDAVDAVRTRLDWRYALGLDAAEPVQPVGATAQFRDDPGDNRVDRPPGYPQKGGEPVVLHGHGRPEALLLEIAGETRVRPRPRHGGDEHAAFGAFHAGHVGLDLDRDGPQVQRPPPAPPAAPVATRAHTVTAEAPVGTMRKGWTWATSLSSLSASSTNSIFSATACWTPRRRRHTLDCVTPFFL